MRVKFVYEGHLVKVKVTGAKKMEKFLFAQCKTSIDNNPRSTKHTFIIFCALQVGVENAFQEQTFTQ